jgi:hypothetical protein
MYGIGTHALQQQNQVSEIKHQTMDQFDGAAAGLCCGRSETGAATAVPLKNDGDEVNNRGLEDRLS